MNKEVGTIAALEQSASRARDFNCLVPLPIVVMTKVVGLPCQALMDSGSLGDFISTTLVDQLELATFELEKPITLHMACQGSRSKINLGCIAEIEYQGIREKRYFDVVNLFNSWYSVFISTPSGLEIQ